VIPSHAATRTAPCRAAIARPAMLLPAPAGPVISPMGLEQFR